MIFLYGTGIYFILEHQNKNPKNAVKFESLNSSIARGGLCARQARRVSSLQTQYSNYATQISQGVLGLFLRTNTGYRPGYGDVARDVSPTLDVRVRQIKRREREREPHTAK